MTLSRALQDFQIEEFLEEESEIFDACSEEEDNLSVDDVQSDYEHDLINDFILEEVAEGSENSLTTPHRPPTSTSDRIIVLPQRSIKEIRNRSKWTSSWRVLYEGVI
ncbi:unnamed protein product [Parnassius apollo]|uniref:(apollo) hypothetical protein n=1 Tax=Parnassius apollo TaxID=110799 RepID=A0A8S3XIT7_PARAO|nr:unnamed protein product [Parnassius apollo]